MGRRVIPQITDFNGAGCAHGTFRGVSGATYSPGSEFRDNSTLPCQWAQQESLGLSTMTTVQTRPSVGSRPQTRPRGGGGAERTAGVAGPGARPELRTFLLSCCIGKSLQWLCLVGPLVISFPPKEMV